MRTFLSLGLFVLALTAQAGTLTYNFQLQTSEGYDVHQIMMYASNGAGQDDIYFNPVTVPASGVFQLQHTVGFDATEAMIIGTMQRNQDSNMDLVMWVSDSFASDVLGMRYSDVFPNGVNGPNPGHNAWPGLIAAAAGGDAGSLSTLYDFFRRSHVSNPLFAPTGSYSIIEFSVVLPPIGTDTPEPATLSLIGLAGVMLLVRARRG
ncbi:MAG: PEP-CTERM sorting domain-containing protein [Acidobacteria bacterium]|nr:PEP-CTERM sorting domain-containing protein [Acidobacteriota bacterium]